MKRSGPPKRNKRLTSNPDTTREWRDRTRSRLNVMSEKRQARIEAENRDSVRTAVFARDGGCLLARAPRTWLGPCFGPLTPHHLRKEGQGGTYTTANLVALCAHHNGAVEDFPSFAADIGLVVRPGITHADAATRRRANGLVPC